MKTFTVEIKEVHVVEVEVELDDNATRADIIAAAKTKFEEEGGTEKGYVYTLDDDEWMVT